MKLLLLTVLAVFIQSCAVFSRYDSGQHRLYHHSLTDTETANLKEKGTIVKQWNGTNNLGDVHKGSLLVQKIGDKKYNFIEIGQWEQIRLLKRSDKKLGTLNITTRFDSLGNIMEQSQYFKGKEDLQYWLQETIKSNIGTIDTTLILIQNLLKYYPSGKIMCEMELVSLDATEERSDELKLKQLAEEPKYYDENGQRVGFIEDKYAGLIKFTKMK